MDPDQSVNSNGLDGCGVNDHYAEAARRPDQRRGTRLQRMETLWDTANRLQFERPGSNSVAALWNGITDESNRDTAALDPSCAGDSTDITGDEVKAQIDKFCALDGRNATQG